VNWKRVAIFTGVMFAATAVAAFPFGFAQGFISSSGGVPPAWLALGQPIAVPLAATVVFFSLARRESARAYEHAWAVWALSMLVSFPINVLGMDLPVGQWIGGSIPLVIALFVGVSVGLRSEHNAA